MPAGHAVPHPTSRSARWLLESNDAHRLQGDLESASERWERLGRRDDDVWRENVTDTRARLDRLPLSPRAERYLRASSEVVSARPAGAATSSRAR